MKIAIVGLGLIGGSMALDLKAQINVEVFGVDSNEANAKKALSLGLVHHIISLEEGIRHADVLVLATPVDIIEQMLPQVLTSIQSKTVVIDVGSTKEEICKCVLNHPNRSQFVAAHPLAGTEFSGPEAALKGLFREAKNIICDKELSNDSAIQIAEKVMSSLGMSSYYMSSQEHDRHLAYVSHLSHVTSFSLGLTVLDIEKDESQIFNLASTGFQSTSRLAKSNPKTWSAIFGKNRKFISQALEGYIETLNKFKKAIDENNIERMTSLMKEANEIKRVLNK